MVVTGVGIVSPLGSLPAFWDRLCSGGTGVAPIEEFDPGPGPPRMAAFARDWQPKDHIAPSLLRRMDHLSRMVVTACRMALADARLTLDAQAAADTGMVLGTAFGNLRESLDLVRDLFARGPGRVNPLTFPNVVLNAPTGYAAIDLGLHGPCFTVTRGEASGEAALALAYDTIVSGHADVLLVGGADEIAPILFHVYRDIGVLSPDAPAAIAREWASPFDRRRNGFVMGEGAAILVLESAEHAAARGAASYAELAGYATEAVAASPHDWPSPAVAESRETERQLAAIGWCRSGGGTRARADLVVSCANSTLGCDAFEAARLAALLGEASGRVLVTSIKGAIGEFGGAGAHAAAAAVLALRTGRVPWLGALEEPDPACTLSLATRQTPPPEGFAQALVSASSRGGSCLTLLFRRA